LALLSLRLLAATLQGLFVLAKRLFDVDIEPADGQVPVWHEDVSLLVPFNLGTFKSLCSSARPCQQNG
jgi:hypothetical protein